MAARRRPVRSPRERTPQSTPLLIDHIGAAHLLGLSPLTIRLPEFRLKHGIPFVKVGALVKYEPEALRAYIRRRRVNGGPEAA
jgi:hypothetical protein